MPLHSSWVGLCEDVKAGTAAAILLLLGEHEREEREGETSVW